MRIFFAPPEVKAISRYSEFGSHLGVRTFGVALGLAVLLHAGIFGMYAMTPHEKVIKVPVRALNINLGATMNDVAPLSEQPLQENASLPPPPPKPEALEEQERVNAKKAQAELENALNGRQPQEKTSAAKNAVDSGIHLPAVKKSAREKAEEKKEAARASAPKRYVRESPLDITKAKEGATNTAADAGKPEEIVHRYEQAISEWIKQRQTYPEEAKRRHVEGTALVRVRTNRQGHILYYVIETSTGDAFLDHAAMSMVRASDPVPAVPANYPATDEVLEFLVPITFKLER